VNKSRAAFLAASIILLTACARQMVARNDVTLAIVNARVWTANPRQPWATGLAVSGDRILSVGSSAEIAKLARQHNNANIICLPSRFVGVEEAKEMVDIFLNTSFEGGRHQARVDKIAC